MIYFDNAATTYPKPEAVYEAMDRANRELAINVGRGTYKLAGKVTDMIEDTRVMLKNLVHAPANVEVILTESATIACNQIIGGLEWSRESVVYVSPYEHNAILRPLYQMQRLYGFQIEELAVLPDGEGLDLDKIAYQFATKAPTVICMSHVSNVIGYIVPIENVIELARDYRPVIVVDGSQALGLIPVDLQKNEVDFYVFAGHKALYGPIGAGGFITTRRIPLKPYISGGTGSRSLDREMPELLPERYEAGSRNIVAIAGLKAALENLPTERERIHEMEIMRMLRSGLWNIPEVMLYLPQKPPMHIGVLAFNVWNYKADELGMILDQDYDIAVRTGYHCAPLIHKYMKDEWAAGVVRVGVSRFTTEKDVWAIVDAVRELAEGV